MRKKVLYLIVVFIVGVLVGTCVTYTIMHKQNDENASGLQEKIALEAKKLMLRNDMYNYIEVIEKRISEELKEDEKLVLSYSSLSFEKDKFKEINENGETVENGFEITDIPFKSETPKDNSIITINEKGKIEEATIYVEGYKLHYDFVGVDVSVN